jgi:hypothetical protein
MIRFIEDPRPDYLKISMKAFAGEMSSANQKTKSQIIRDAVFMAFNMGFADLKRDKSFQLFEKNGANLVIKKMNNDHDLTLKGFFWLQLKAYMKVKIFLHQLSLHGVDFKIQRLDIRRNFQADKVEDPMADIKKGFWINKSSAESFFYPETLIRGKKESVGSSFRSSQFHINTYDKSDQMRSLEKRIQRLKKDDRKERLKVQINRHKELYGDKVIYRFEIKLLESKNADNFRQVLGLKASETDFCQNVLSAFYRSYPMKSGKDESRNYKLFFQGGTYEKKDRRKSRSIKSN